MTITWLDHVAKWKDCQRCPLGRQRFRICLARGTVPCDVLLVGQGPGASEDAIGEPFRGPAGDKLDQIVERALDPSVRVAFTNLVCCFPREAKAAGNEEPAWEEVEACRPRLVEFANIVQPRLVVCVGTLASRGVKEVYSGPRVEILHPAFILSRLPQAQKRFALDKCVVQIRSAWDEVVASGNTNFTKWEDRDAEVKAVRERYIPVGHDNIPF